MTALGFRVIDGCAGPTRGVPPYQPWYLCGSRFDASRWFAAGVQPDAFRVDRSFASGLGR